MRKALAFILILITLPALRAQVAGISSYSVLDMPSSARIVGLGFDFMSVYDDDIVLTLDNPSLISSRTSSQLSAALTTLFTGVKFGSVAYSHNFKHLGAFTFGLQFDSYGKFAGYDESETPMGDFSAGDYVFSIGWGRAIDDNVLIGANFKPIFSQYEEYSAFAFAIDLAATYISNDKSFAATLMGRNIGAQIITFSGTTERLPYELSLAASYKLADAPFRLHFMLNELQKWNLAYDDPLNPTTTTDPFTGAVTKQSDFSRIVDNLFRHVGVGIELRIKQLFYATVGYSYRQMVEMTAAESFNLSGFSFGFGLDVKGFKVAYARNNYHLSQAPNFISITTSLDRFFR